MIRWLKNWFSSWVAVCEHRCAAVDVRTPAVLGDGETIYPLRVECVACGEVSEAHVPQTLHRQLDQMRKGVDVYGGVAPGALEKWRRIIHGRYPLPAATRPPNWPLPK